MALHIKPLVAKMLTVLQARTPQLLSAASRDPFVDYIDWWNGVIVNHPTVCVLPGSSEFDRESEQARKASHAMLVRAVFISTEPHDLNQAAFDYVKAIDDAIVASFPALSLTSQDDWSGTPALGQVNGIWIASHQYGMSRRVGQGIEAWMDVPVIIETEELP